MKFNDHLVRGPFPSHFLCGYDPMPYVFDFVAIYNHMEARYYNIFSFNGSGGYFRIDARQRFISKTVDSITINCSIKIISGVPTPTLQITGTISSPWYFGNGTFDFVFIAGASNTYSQANQTIMGIPASISMVRPYYIQSKNITGDLNFITSDNNKIPITNFVQPSTFCLAW